MASDEAPFSSILDDLEGAGDAQTVSAGAVIDGFQHRSLGVLLTVFGLIAALPVIGGVPGMSMATGTLILVAVAQSFVGGGTLWLPDAVRRREIERDRYVRALEASRPWLERLDRLVRPRLKAVADGRVNRWLISLAVALLAVTFFPLAFVPWGVTAPAFGVVAFGVGLMACDGAFVLAGYALSALTLYVLYETLLGVEGVA